MHVYRLKLNSLIALDSCTFMQDQSPVPSYYTLILEPLDGHIDYNLINISVQRSGELVNMSLNGEIPPKTL